MFSYTTVRKISSWYFWSAVLPGVWNFTCVSTYTFGHVVRSDLSNSRYCPRSQCHLFIALQNTFSCSSKAITSVQQSVWCLLKWSKAACLKWYVCLYEYVHSDFTHIKKLDPRNSRYWLQVQGRNLNMKRHFFLIQNNWQTLLTEEQLSIPDFKHPSCSECCMLSSG